MFRARSLVYGNRDGGITDAGYAAIARMRGLRELTLGARRGAPSDEALGKLAQLPGLRTLTLSFEEPTRRYTAAGIDAFRARRPDVVLTVDGTTYPATSPPPSP